jgi:hypothetical protein
LGIAQALALATAAGCGFLLASRDFAGDWLANRLKAEQGRLAKAHAALEIGHAQGAASFKAAADHFSTDLIDGQLTHLRASSKRHGRRAFVLAVLGAVLTGLGVFASSVGAVGLSWLILIAAFVGVLSPALIAALRSWQESSADREREKLHRATADELNGLRGRRDELDAAVAANDLQAALTYAEAVFAVLRTDHLEFAKLYQPGQ